MSVMAILRQNDMLALRPVSEIAVVMADEVMFRARLASEPGIVPLLIQPVWR
jgi:hypothetical protein